MLSLVKPFMMITSGGETFKCLIAPKFTGITKTSVHAIQKVNIDYFINYNKLNDYPNYNSIGLNPK